jgi:hypothetical protein
LFPALSSKINIKAKIDSKKNYENAKTYYGKWARPIIELE